MRTSSAVNLRQLEAFRAVVEAGSVSQAADLLSLSQPAVSKHVAAFEQQMGFAVFERRRGRLVPTPEALLLYEEVARALSGIDTIAQAADDIRKGRHGRVALGCSPAMSLGFVQRIIEPFAATHPQVRITLQTRTSIQLISMTAARRVDLALVADFGERSGIDTLASWALECVVLMPADHRLAARSTVQAEDLHQERMIALSSLDGLQPRIDAVLQEHGVSPDYQTDTPLTGSAAACVASGLGIALVDPIVAETFSSDAIVARPFAPVICLSVCLIAPTERTPSALVRKTIERVKDHFEDWRATHPGAS